MSLSERAGAFHTWVEEHSHTLTGGGLWMTGREPGRPDPDRFRSAELEVLVVRLSTYRDVALSLSHGLVAALFRNAGDTLEYPVFADLAFLPPLRDARLLKKCGWPLLFGTSTGRPARSFDVLAFSCSHASEFLNLAWLLDGSDIPLAFQERMADPDLPWIFMGGAAACHTSPLQGDVSEPGSGGLLDGALMGDGEAAIPPLVETLIAGKKEGSNRKALLDEFGRKVPGFYDPRMTVQVFSENGRGALTSMKETAHAANLPAQRALSAPYTSRDPKDMFFIPFEPEAFGAAPLLISRGCPCFCAFCREGWENRPYRERPMPELEEAMADAKAALGAEAFHPSAFNFDMHASLFPLLEAAGRLFHEVKPKSERFDLMAAQPATARAAARMGKRVFTLGMEGISSRLIRFLGKDIEISDVLKSVELLVRVKASELKIFLIATGLEEDEDYLEFESLLTQIKKLTRSRGRGSLRLVFSLSPLIVQPHTPLQFLPRGITSDRFDAVHRRIEVLCREAGAECRTSALPHEIDVLQILNIGDRRLTPALVEVSLTGRFLYFRKIPKGTDGAMKQALAKQGIDAAVML
ncbi:MAG: radical SAM protein, partial [Planctomycetota bacterium]